MLENFERFGRSGCRLYLTHKGSRIRKVSSSLEYNNRLRLQCIKQSSFQNQGNFTTPTVYGNGSLSELYYFDMEYVHGRTFEKFCIESGASSINAFVDELGDFIEGNIDRSIKTHIDTHRLAEKLDHLQSLVHRELRPYLDYLRSTIPTTLSIGPTHGDLTMSNIIFSDKYYLVDFLDNIYDTPIIDLVKVKQDTQHKFFLNLVDHDHTKITMCLNYIDTRINERFPDIIESSEFTWLSIYNLIRVLPYLTNPIEKQSIINSLQKYEHTIARSR